MGVPAVVAIEAARLRVVAGAIVRMASVTIGIMSSM
jgi:hypothetical protein